MDDRYSLKDVKDYIITEEKQTFFKSKLDEIKSVDINEKIEFNTNKADLLKRVEWELKSLKAIILAFRKTNIEFHDYHYIYRKFENLCTLHSYLKEDIEKTKIKVK